MMALAVLMSTITHRAMRPPLSHREHVSAFFRMMQMNVRRMFGVVVVLATAAFAILFIAQMAVTEVVLWDDYSYYVGRAFVVIGPVFAIWSAILAQRDMRPARLELLASTASSRCQRELRIAIVGVLMAVGCYVVVAAAVLGYAATKATWGGPDLWIITYGATATALFAFFGWLMGALLPSRVTPLSAGLVTLLFTIVSYTWGPERNDVVAFQPYRYVSNSGFSNLELFYDIPSYPDAPHPAGGILLALGGMATVVASHLVWRRSKAGLALMALAVVFVAPGWVVATDRETVNWSGAPIEHPDMVCGGDVMRLCLHQAYEAQLDAGATMLDAVLAPVAPFADLPDTLTQQFYGTDEPPAGIVSLNAGWSNTDIEWVLTDPLSRAMFSLEDGSFPDAAQGAVLMWLFDRAGYTWAGHPGYGSEYHANLSAAAERFAMLPEAEQQAWLETNWDALRARELTLEDLP